MNKLHELSSRITDEFPDIIFIAEVKPKDFKRTLSLVEYNIVGRTLKLSILFNILVEACCYLLKRILNIS